MAVVNIDIKDVTKSQLKTFIGKRLEFEDTEWLYKTPTVSKTRTAEKDEAS